MVPTSATQLGTVTAPGTATRTAGDPGFYQTMEDLGITGTADGPGFAQSLEAVRRQ